MKTVSPSNGIDTVDAPEIIAPAGPDTGLREYGATPPEGEVRRVDDTPSPSVAVGRIVTLCAVVLLAIGGCVAVFGIGGAGVAVFGFFTLASFATLGFSGGASIEYILVITLTFFFGYLTLLCAGVDFDQLALSAHAFVQRIVEPQQ
jgi:hypothetical protein